MADYTNGELTDQCDELAKLLDQKYGIVADYESAYEHAKKLTIRARADAISRTSGPPSMVKMLIENDPQVIAASDNESVAFELLTRGNAEIKGLEANFQKVKHFIQLRIQETKSLGGAR